MDVGGRAADLLVDQDRQDEPEPGLELEADGQEYLERIGLGTPDVAAAVAELKQRGVLFSESARAPISDRGAVVAASTIAATTPIGSFRTTVVPLPANAGRCSSSAVPRISAA